MPLIFLHCDAVAIPFNDTVEFSPALTDGDVVAVHGCHDVLFLDAASPHARARASHRQSETAERCCHFIFPILCGVTRAVQAASQQSTHVFVTRLVVLGRQFDKHFYSCWSATIRPPSARRQMPTPPLTFARCDLNQDDFQGLQWRCRPMQLWSGVCLVFLRNPSRAPKTFPGCPLSVSAHPVLIGAFPISRKHTSLGTLTYIILCRRMHSTSSRLALAHNCPDFLRGVTFLLKSGWFDLIQKILCSSVKRLRLQRLCILEYATQMS